MEAGEYFDHTYMAEDEAVFAYREAEDDDG